MLPAMPTHNANAVIWRYNPVTQDVEFLVVDVITTYHGVRMSAQTKFPGGGNDVEQEPREPVLSTLIREILEETRLQILTESPEQIWEYEVPFQRHTKFGYLVPFAECQGELRTEWLRVKNDEISPPRWERAIGLHLKLTSESHLLLHLRACRRLDLLAA